MLEELVTPVLVLVVSFLLKLAAKAIELKLDEASFNAIVLAIVGFLVSLAFGEPIRAALFGG